MTHPPTATPAPEPPITPIPLPAGVERVLLFGGTFDPVHRGHTEAAAAARDQAMGPDAWLVFVPAARSPLKQSAPEATDAQRLEMLRLALQEVPRAVVWTDELSRPPPSYWIDTLRRARTALGSGPEVRFLIGADQAVDFCAWREWRAILAAAEPVVMARPPVRTAADFVAALGANGWSAADIEKWITCFADAAIVDISACETREAIAARDQLAAKRLAPSVYAFIQSNRLYANAAG